MVKRQTDTDSFTLTEPGGSGTGSLVATAVVAAAVGAGVALLFAPEKGVKTRKRLGKRMRKLELAKQFDELELGKRAAHTVLGAYNAEDVLLPHKVVPRSTTAPRA